MGVGMLLAIALIAILVLLVFVIKFEFSAYVSLLLVAMGTAVVAGIPIADVVPVMIEGMGKVLGSVAIIVGLGSMLGRMVEVSGGAEVLATKFTERLGQKRVVAAVTIAAFILGIPVFFDVGFIILAPIVFAFAKIAGLHPVRIGLPVAGVLIVVHVALPPHPGPVAAAASIGTNVGLMTLLGLVLCAIVSVVGFFVAKLLKVEHITLQESPATEALAEGDETGSGASGGGSAPTDLAVRTRPGAGLITTLIVLPIAMIMVGSVTALAASSATCSSRPASARRCRAGSPIRGCRSSSRATSSRSRCGPRRVRPRWRSSPPRGSFNPASPRAATPSCRSSCSRSRCASAPSA